jgi:hypothetical protein
MSEISRWESTAMELAEKLRVAESRVKELEEALSTVLECAQTFIESCVPNAARALRGEGGGDE